MAAEKTPDAFFGFGKKQNTTKTQAAFTACGSILKQKARKE